MASGVKAWSQTAASNATADSNINWAEGQAPSSVNDSSRAMMAAIAKFRDDNAGSLTTGGTSTAYTLTTNATFASLTELSGNTLTVRFNATNGAAPTLNVDSLGAKNIQTASGTAVATGALLADSVHRLTYDNSIPAFLLQNNHSSLVGLNITGGTAETSPAVADEIPLYDASATANRKMTLANLFKVITSLTAETSPATDDELALYDASASTADKITIANLLKVINSLTEDTSPDGSADFLVTYDASASGVKKVLPSSLGASAAAQETGTATTSFVTPGVQHRHQSAAKAWGKFAGDTGTLASGSYNITSVVRDSGGDYTVTIGTDFSSADYVVALTCVDGTNTRAARVRTQAAGSFTIKVVDSGGSDSDPEHVMFVCYGDHA